MKKTTKTKWIKALNSGAYKQHRGELTNDCDGGERKYCCLGVLNRIRHHKQCCSSFDDVLTQTEQDKLVELNDDKKYTFKQIANYIEKHIEGK